VLRLLSVLSWCLRMNRFAFVVCLLLPAVALPACARDLAQTLAPAASEREDAAPATTGIAPDVLYRLLAAELAAQRGQYEVAGTTLLDVARETQDARLAQRAFQLFMINRDFARAFAAARQWARLAPTDQQASAALLALIANSGQTEGLAEALTQRIAQADDKDAAIAQAAGVVSRLRDKEAAVKVLEQTLLPAWQDRLVARLVLADTAWAARDATRALAHARAAQQLDPASEDAAQRILEYGVVADPEAALAQTRAFLQAHPEARDVHLALVAQWADRGEVDEALAHLRAMRAQTPEDFDLLYVEAQVHAQAQQYPQARALLNEYIQVQTQRRQALAQDGNNDASASVADARLLLARIAEDEGNLDEALAQLDRVDDPALEFRVLLQRASFLGRLGQLAQARALLEGFAAGDARERMLLAQRLASIYVDAGRTDEAVRVLENATQKDPDVIPLQYDLAMLYERQGRIDGFEERMQHILALDPDNVNANNALGYTLADQNRRLDEAQVLIERAEQLEPDNPYILDSVGWYYYRRGDLERAEDYLRRSWNDLPAADVAAHLGEVLWTRHNADEARAVWRAGLLLEPDSEVLRKTLMRLGVTLP